MVDSAPESLTAAAVAADSVGSLPIWPIQVVGLAAGRVLAHLAGRATFFAVATAIYLMHYGITRSAI
jgi:hypothetical protein